jgi:hypothetical protein
MNPVPASRTYDVCPMNDHQHSLPEPPEGPQKSEIDWQRDRLRELGIDPVVDPIEILVQLIDHLQKANRKTKVLIACRPHANNRYGAYLPLVRRQLLLRRAIARCSRSVQIRTPATVPGNAKIAIQPHSCRGVPINSAQKHRHSPPQPL